MRDLRQNVWGDDCMKYGRRHILKTCRRYMKGTGIYIFLLLLCSLAALPISLISPRFFQILVDDVMAKGRTNLFPVVVIGLLGVYAARFLVDGGNLLCSNAFLNRFTYTLRCEILGKYLHMPYENYRRYDTGNLKMRLMDDVDCLGNFIQNQIVDYACGFLMMGASLFLCWRINGRLLLYASFVLPLVFLIDYLIGRGNAKINEKIRQVNEQYYGFEHNALQFWKEMKAQCAEKTFVDKFKYYRRELARLGMVSIRYWFYHEVFNDFKANYCTKVLIYIIGAFFVMNRSITVGMLIMFGEYFTMLFTAIDGVYSKNIALREQMPYYKRIQETLAFEDEKNGNHPASAETMFPIRMEHVSFTYPGTGQPVLQEVSLTIHQGDYVALTGSSGAGKTTLVKLLLGILKPQQGEIYFGQQAMQTIKREDLLQQIGVVMQDSYLFNTTIRENLQLANPLAVEEQLQEALRKAAIWDFIQSLPQGMDTMVGEQGVRLSGGQKQRLVIARMLLKNPSLLLLDEATSALDKMAEDSIDEAIHTLAKEKTMLVISHKPQTIRRAREIWKIHEGRLERGHS